ncbi:MMPL family transporter [Skermania sp. ID1734]|uniref:MMPL family transporter n=1 Tax=Skermania sp. ID1734 TaxID=2597516 RepID=UPI0011807BFB|nr:MMPL family transporter [Skermania sp. ID1734]TSE00260.1 MMPL family transporter [Skermania sp. ID1734]
MFTRWGGLVYRLRYTVIGVMVVCLLALGGYGLGLSRHLSQSGWDDPGSQSSQAAQLLDATYGRDHTADVVAIYTAPPGKTVDDPVFAQKIKDNLNNLVRQYPDQILKINGGYYKTDTGQQLTIGTVDKSHEHAIMSIAIKGDTDTEQAQNFTDVEDAFNIPGINVQLAGLQPVAGGLNATMQADVHRMEILAIPVVAILLFFIFGGIVAAALPLIIGGLTVIGAWGIVRIITNFTEVNAFVLSVVSLIGLGLAIDYGLFIVSRFREELAEGYDTATAVRRSVMTAGRTVVSSATMIVASLGGLLIFPQGFLKSVAYGAIATVGLAAICAITILPALLGILGRRVDALGLKFFRKTKSTEEIENGFWGKLTRWVMKHPLKVTIPIVIGLLLLIIPVNAIQFGGISEKYLPPDNSTRMAQEEFDKLFPNQRTNPIKLVVETSNTLDVGKVLSEANNAPGLVSGGFQLPTTPTKDNLWVLQSGLQDTDHAKPTIDYLRSMPVPADAKVMVTGTPAIQQDSITALLDRMPLMIVIVLAVTTILMFLTFGSLVLPIKAALMSALGLGSTLGILTWIFVDGHGAKLLNFTPGPIMSPVLVLIIAIIYGLSTDYEVFLLSRMVEARTLGASTTEAVRVGTAHTGRIITAAALILIVVTGAFGFSDLVMMQYIAYGMISALIIDATLIRMFLVPATMKLLGDDCWWAPAWLKRLQEKLGLGEPILEDERIHGEVPDLGAQLPTQAFPVGTSEPRTEPFGRIAAPSRIKPPPQANQPAPPRPSSTFPVPPRQPSARPTPPAEPESAAPETGREEIANWLADLRRPKDRVSNGAAAPEPAEAEQPTEVVPEHPAPNDAETVDERGRHHRSGGGPGLTVSELLKRQNPS